MKGEEVKALGGWKAQSAVAEYVCAAKGAGLNTAMMQCSAQQAGEVALNKKGQFMEGDKKALFLDVTEKN